MSSTFSSLREPNYRIYAGAQIVSLTGTWMQRIAQDWLVLDLTDGNATALGIAAALQFGPTLLLSLWGGVLADRVDKRRALVVLQSLMGGCALALGLSVVTGIVTVPLVYVLCLLLGCFSALDVPVRQSFVSEIVGIEQVGNAVALNSLTFNLARIAGPSVAGVLIGVVGTGPVFLINAGSFAATIAGLCLMNADLLRTVEREPRGPGQLRAGLTYVASRPDLVAVLTLVFLVSTFGINFFLSLPVLARSVFGLGADAYGLLTTLLACGSVAGALLAARRMRRPRLRTVTGSALVFGVVVIVAGSMPTFALTCVLMVPLGLAALTFTTAANSSVQLSVDPAMRGRVMGLYMLVFLGGTPLGAPVLGWLAEVAGGRMPLLAGGAVTVLAVLGVGAVLAWRQRSAKALAREARLG